MRCAPNQKKAFNKGIEGLLGEGAVQVGFADLGLEGAGCRVQGFIMAGG
jgi:hypothetical protein